MNYAVDYFIAKFENIELGVLSFKEGCALGKCGMMKFSQLTPEAEALVSLFIRCLYDTEPTWDGIETVSKGGNAHWIVVNINDGMDARYQQPTAKQRILAALYDIRRMQQPEVKPKREKVKPSISPDLLAPPIPKEEEKIDRVEIKTLNN